MLSDNRRSLLFYSLALAFALFCALLAHYPIVENDLFWQVRAGEEILKTGSVQTTDAWSHTAAGLPWYNFQWLSTVLMYAVSSLRPDYFFLPTLRSLLVLALVLATCRLFASLTRRDRYRLPLFALGLPVWYLLCSPRFQMRPELFSLIIYTTLVTVWVSERSLKWRYLLTLALLVAWSNFHGGTAPFAILAACGYFLAASDGTFLRLWQRLALAVGLALTWFASPIGINVMHAVLVVATDYTWTDSSNVDQRPFALSMLAGEGAVFQVLWIAYTIATLICYLRSWINMDRLPLLYRGKKLIAAVALLLTVAALQRVRAQSYQVIFLFPVFIECVRRAIEAVSARSAARYSRGLFVSLVLLSAYLMSQRAPQSPGAPLNLGFGVKKGVYPVQSAKFLATVRPRGNMYNTYNHGGYLIAQLREYPVSVDPRELPFLPWLRELNAAREQGSVSAFERFHDKYGVNTILSDLPLPDLIPGVGFIDSHASFAPKKDWALVFFDDASLVYLRRIPEHKKIIQEHEYKYLYHGLPANFAAVTPGLTDEFKAGFEHELDRCLRNLPENTYCLLGKAAFHKQRQQSDEALRLFELARAHAFTADTIALIDTEIAGLRR